MAGRYGRQSTFLLRFAYEQLAIYTVLFASHGVAILKEWGTCIL